MNGFAYSHYTLTAKRDCPERSHGGNRFSLGTGQGCLISLRSPTL
jgi:hypothetical protein